MHKARHVCMGCLEKDWEVPGATRRIPAGKFYSVCMGDLLGLKALFCMRVGAWSTEFSQDT